MADDEGEQLGLGALYSRDFGDDDDDADADFEAGSEDEEEDLDFEACGDDEHDGHAAPSASTKPSIASAPQDGRTASGGVGEALASGQPEKMKTGSAGAEQQEPDQGGEVDDAGDNDEDDEDEDEDEEEDEEEHEPGQDLTLSWPQGEDPCKITFPF